MARGVGIGGVGPVVAGDGAGGAYGVCGGDVGWGFGILTFASPARTNHENFSLMKPCATVRCFLHLVCGGQVLALACPAS